MDRDGRRGIVAMLASLPIGWLCFRLRGPYFTIATIATAQALMLIFLKFRDLAWGAKAHDPRISAVRP